MQVTIHPQARDVFLAALRPGEPSARRADPSNVDAASRRPAEFRPAPAAMA
jgi:hypothetical protein